MWTSLIQYKGIAFNLISHQDQLIAHLKLVYPEAVQIAFLKFTNFSIGQDIFHRIQDDLLKV